MVFESEAQAKSYWDQVKDRITAGNTLESTNYANAPGFKSKISGLKRQTLHYIVQLWKNLCEGAAGGPDGNDGDPADLPEVGKTVMMTAPFLFQRLLCAVAISLLFVLEPGPGV